MKDWLKLFGRGCLAGYVACCIMIVTSVAAWKIIERLCALIGGER